MIRSFTVTNPNNESLTIELDHPEKSGFQVKSIDGLGAPKNSINISESLYLNGGTFNSSKSQSRDIQIHLGFQVTDTETIEQIRLKSYRFFPSNTRLSFVFTTDSRNGLIIGWVESNDVNIFSNEEGCVISIRCPSSYFLSTESYVNVFSGTTPGFTLPWENPSLVSPLIEFGTVFINTQGNIFYAGDIRSGLVIRINFVGSVGTLNIINTSTGETMTIDSTKLASLTGSGFVNGDSLLIVTSQGSKTILLTRGTTVYNILNALSNLNTWFTLDKGDNVFTFTASSGLSNVRFSTEHRLVYEGI